MIKPLSESESVRLRSIGRKLGRDRHQDGWVEEVGKKRKRFRGHFFVYEKTAAKEIRRHRNVGIGLKSEMTKSEAKQKLREIIAEETKPTTGIAGIVTIPKRCTLRQFWEHVAAPMWEPTWKWSSRQDMKGTIERYIVKPFDGLLLSEITKAMLQMHINHLAERGFSKSVVEKALIWSRALMEEAADQDYIPKNPARKLEMPKTKKPDKTVAEIERVRMGLAKLPEREQLILRMTIVLGLRPGETLAVKRNDCTDNALRIDEGNRHGCLTDAKSEASAASVWIPSTLLPEIKKWLDRLPDKSPEALLFPSPTGKVPRLDNYRSRFWNPAMEAAGLKGLTLQRLRRSCGTFMADKTEAKPKEIQGHLRHAQVNTTMDIYVQEIPESTRRAVESLDDALFGKPLVRAAGDSMNSVSTPSITPSFDGV